MLIMATDPGAFMLPANQAMKMDSDILYDVLWDTFEGVANHTLNQEYQHRRQPIKTQAGRVGGSTTGRRKKVKI
jgi:hypothetical protein